MLPIIFQGREFAIVDHEGRQYVTADTLAQLLGARSAEHVLQIRRRHPEEFADGRAIETASERRGGRAIVLFNPIGMLAAAVHTNTEVGTKARVYLLDLANREYQHNFIVQSTAATLYQAALSKFTGFRQTVYAEDIERAAGLLPGQATEEAWNVLADQLEKLRPFCAQMKFKTTGAPVRFFQSMSPDQLKLNKGASLDELMPDPDPEPMIGRVPPHS